MDRERALKTGQSFLMAAQPDQSDAPHAETICEQRIEPDNLAQYVLRLFELLPVQINQPEPVKRIKITGIGAQQFMIEPASIRQPARLIGGLRLL